jgi:hypothetical protein
MTIELKKFDMKYITFDEKSLMIIIIGGEETVKSFLVRDILNHYQNIPIGTVIASSKTKFNFYSKFISKKLFYDEYNPIIIENIFIRQKMIMSRVEEEIQNKQSTTDPRTIVVLDNCFYDDFMRHKVTCNLIMNGKIWKISSIITMSHPLPFPPTLQTNIDYVFVLRETVNDNRKIIYQNYALFFASFEEFSSVLDNFTEEYECLVIKKNSLSRKLEDVLFWYRAKYLDSDDELY